MQGTIVTLKNILVGVLMVLLAMWAAKILRRILERRVFPRFDLDVGLKYAFGQLATYLVLVVGVYAGLTVAGFPMGLFVGIFALLSVGIGFGMQNLASNFISGLILLLERPIQVGDRICVGGLWGDVKKISLRTTVLETVDRMTVLVPNSHLLENEVTNSGYGDRRVRIHVPVGVAYGSDVDLVTRLLKGVAADEPLVIAEPEPDVHFLAFGASSLDLELLVWLAEESSRAAVMDRLNRAIDRVFREHDVEIPFPQRVVHMPARVG